MDKLEMAEKLVEKCGISYEEAGEVLREADFDLLEAMIILEKRGKMGGAGNSYSTGRPKTEYSGHKSAADAESFGEFIRITGRSLGDRLRDIFRYRLIAVKDGREAWSLPFAAVLVFICCSAGLVFAAMLISIAAGYSYRVEKV